MIKKQSGEERVYLSLQLHSTVHQWRKSGKELKRGKDLERETDAEALEGLLLDDLLGLLAYSTQGHQPKNGTTHNGLGLLHQ